jgi:hypothetical protein
MTDSDLERRLRRALHDDAASITPSDRRQVIEALAQEGAAPSGRSRWLAPVAGAAAVAVVVTLAWGATEVLRPAPDGGTTPVAAASTPAPSGPSPTPSGDAPSATPSTLPGVTPPEPSSSGATTPVPGTSATPDSSGTATSPATASVPPAAAGAVTLPVYVVGAVGGEGTDRRYGLFREFVTATVPQDATPGQRAQAALSTAMRPTTDRGQEPGLRPWKDTTVSQVTVADGRIAVELSDAGPDGLSSEQARLAVQGLVWTATAAVGQGNLPVRFSVADGATSLLGAYPTSAAYTRPAADASYQDLAPIWVEAPATGASLPAARPVVASGTASVFEATVPWRLTRSGAEVLTGFSTASIGAPGRGTWTADLGRLPAGSYTFTAYERSAEDGSVRAQDESTFTVR